MPSLHDQIRKLPTIKQLTASNLKIDAASIRVYVSRMTAEDGEPSDLAVTISRRMSGGEWSEPSPLPDVPDFPDYRDFGSEGHVVPDLDSRMLACLIYTAANPEHPACYLTKNGERIVGPVPTEDDLWVYATNLIFNHSWSYEMTYNGYDIEHVGQFVMADWRAPMEFEGQGKVPCVYLCSAPMRRDDRKHSVLEVCATGPGAAMRAIEHGKELGLPVLGNGCNPADATVN